MILNAQSFFFLSGSMFLGVWPLYPHMATTLCTFPGTQRREVSGLVSQKCPTQSIEKNGGICWSTGTNASKEIFALLSKMNTSANFVDLATVHQARWPDGSTRFRGAQTAPCTHFFSHILYRNLGGSITKTRPPVFFIRNFPLRSM